MNINQKTFSKNIWFYHRNLKVGRSEGLAAFGGCRAVVRSCRSAAKIPTFRSGRSCGHHALTATAYC